jgi:Overcoming lysogenization defect protein-like, TOPRIM domain
MESRLTDSDLRKRARIEAAPPDRGPQATTRALQKVDTARAIVLVEGISDQLAVEALAQRRGRDLDRDGVGVVPIGGAQAIGRFLAQFGPRGSDTRLAGLYDRAEEEVFRTSLERAGLGTNLTRPQMERLGFYVCVEDLEDELIRALGADGVKQVLDTQGDLGSFRTFQKQPAWRGRPTEAQLRRFMGSSAGKARYAPLFVHALDLARMPRPLDGVLAHV